jgi:ribosomal protein L22
MAEPEKPLDEAVPPPPDAPAPESDSLGAVDAGSAVDPQVETPAPAKAKAPASKAKAAAAPKPKAEQKAPRAEQAKPVAADRGKAKPPARRRTKRRPEKIPSGAQPPVVRAQAKYVRTSARKARLVCDHIRGKSVVEARAILAFAPRAVAADWAKLLNSAVANAEHNHELVGEDLRVLAAFADEGPTLKRFRPRAMGRATPIRKRTSHLTITLTPKED